MSSRPGVGGPKLRRLNMGQIFIILAVVSFVITFFVFKSLMGNKTDDHLVKAVKTRPLVVAVSHVYPGEILTEEDLRQVDWPVENYPPADVYDQSSALSGRVAKNDIYPGEPIYRLSLAGEGSTGGMPVIIPRGYRAMTVLVTENKGVAGFIKPGDRVDVIGTFEYQIPEATKKSMGSLLQDSVNVSKTVLQDVRVLAIAQEMYEKPPASSVAATPGPGEAAAAPPATPAAGAGGDPTKAKLVSSVTVAVTPEQAEILAFSDSRGELRLTLRPENEHESLELAGAISNDVIPMEILYDKLLKMGGSGGGGPMGEEFASQAPVNDVPDTSHSGPELGDAGGGGYGAGSIEIIEGTSKSSVSF